MRAGGERRRDRGLRGIRGRGAGAAWKLGAALAVVLAAGCASTVRGPAPPTTPSTPRGTATPAPATPAPTPTPTPTPPPPPLPAPLPASDTAPPVVRVLLERTGDAVPFPQPGRPYRVGWTGGERWLWGPLEARVESASVWQIGAWADTATADAAASRVGAALGDGARVGKVLGDDGLTRVQVRLAGVKPEEARARLTAAGFPDAFAVVGEDRVRLTGSAGEPVVGAAIRVTPWGNYPTAVAGGRYRGGFVLRASHGQTLVINVLNLEAYLRGVVPAEMGPSAFPQLDALKAQAVAARTYAVAHLGDHENEGYDLCDTPACQVYRGVAVEHRLTDRAVRETAGIIAVYGGKPIDAMYTSTCGGHTEDAGVLFPDRAEPYLKGVACAWERPLHLSGTGPPGGWTDLEGFFGELTGTALELGPAAPPAALLAALAARCNGRLVELAPGAGSEETARALLAAGGLEDAAGVLTRGTTALERLLHLADLFGIRIDEPPPVPGVGWLRAAALAVLRLQGVVVRDTGEVVPRPEGVGIFPRRAPHSEALPDDAPLYERWQGRWRRVSAAECLPGTRLERYRVGTRVVAVVIDRSGGGGEADRRSAWRQWARELSWREVAHRVGVNDLVRLEVTRRSASGRVVGLAAVDASGRRTTWEGFEVRRALGLPETLFTFHRITGPGGEPRVRFLGRGWGHGVGLCQNGAYGLARAGMTWDRILRTYYTGIDLVRWQGEPAAGDEGKAAASGGGKLQTEQHEATPSAGTADGTRCPSLPVTPPALPFPLIPPGLPFPSFRPSLPFPVIPTEPPLSRHPDRAKRAEGSPRRP